jgi:hypothetical protein
MSTPPNQQTDEYLQARIESCKLLGLDPTDLSSLEAIRADIVTTLRTWLDGTQGQLLSGGTADPTKILAVAEALGKLVPEREQRSRGEDPRQIMWETYLGMRKRGEIGNAVVEAREVDRLRARVAELEARLAGHLPAESAPPVPAAPADNVVPLKPPHAAVSAAPEEEYEDVVVTEAVLGQPEPWRSYVGGPDNSIISTPGKWWWGPVG